MNFGTVITQECVNVVEPPDPRCADEAFRIANPDICGVSPTLIIKPGTALACVLGSIQFQAFVSRNGQEEDVTEDTVWETSNPTVAVIGYNTGAATGLSAGDAIITATYEGMTATATLSVLTTTGEDCCEEQHVAIMVLVDNTKSMSLSFPGYTTKLGFAKYAATQFIGEVNDTKDYVGLAKFNDADYTELSAPTSDVDGVAAMVAGITQTQQLTSFYTALDNAIDTLSATGADRQVILLISDGEDTGGTYTDDDNPLTLLSEFKAQGGIVICLGVRASGTGFALLSAFATGGFFINAYPPSQATALSYLSGLKGYICAGNCTPDGDELVPTGQFDYTGFINWDVTDGNVDLLGEGFVDVLPGNGLYVNLSGSTAPNRGVMTSNVGYSLDAGHTYRIVLSLSPNWHTNGNFWQVYLRIYTSSGDLLNQTVQVPGMPMGLVDYAYTFTAPADCTAYIEIQQGLAPGGVDLSEPEWGILMNRVLFQDTTDNTTLLDDDFDGENIQYVPPGCGTGTYWHEIQAGVWGYDVGYSCYGEGCLDEPPPAQLPDPNPLADIERGYDPPRLYTSTQEACAECDDGYANYTTANIIPAMTAENTGGYIVEPVPPNPADDVGYESWHAFTGSGYWRNPGPVAVCNIVTPVEVTGRQMRLTPGPDSIGKTYFLEVFRVPPGPPTTPIQWGYITFPLDGSAVTVMFANENSCWGFYIALSAGASDTVDIKQIEILATSVPGPASVCEEATVESDEYQSQQEADNAARAAALALAEPQLNCVRVWTWSTNHTAHCADEHLGCYGPDVTRPGTATSLISEDDAREKAEEAAELAAEEALNCESDNNTAAITINDASAATPYPTAKYIEDIDGLITGVTVFVRGFTHTHPADVRLLLRGPDGTNCLLMQNCGGSNDVTDLDFQFSDDGAAMTEFGTLASGHWAPTQYGAQANFPQPVENLPYGTALSVFNGLSPNGCWSLWVWDDTAVDSGEISGGWDIVFTTDSDTTLYALGDIRLDAADEVLAKSLSDDIPASPDGFIMLGDVIGTASTTDESWGYYWNWGFGDVAEQTLFTPGNHDWTPDGAAVKLSTQQFWQGTLNAVYGAGFPATTLTGDPDTFNYAVKYGTWKIIVFNAEAVHDEAGALDSGGSVYEFIEEELSEEGYDCILASHMPRWAGDVIHGDNLEFDAIWRLAVQYHAVAWIAGHSHFSEIQAQRDSNGNPVYVSGCAQIIAGAGLSSLYALDPGYDPDNIQFDNATDNLLAVLSFNTSGLTVYFLDTTGATVAGSTFRFPAQVSG